MKKYIYASIIFIISLFLDIVTKYLVVANVSEYEKINILGDFVRLTLVYNRGGVFGILSGYQNLLLIVSISVLIFLILFFIFEKNKTFIYCTSISLIISGAIGNIIDRVIDRKGVVDFISIGKDQFFRWPTFNIADITIVIGAFLLIIIYYKEEKKRKEESSIPDSES